MEDAATPGSEDYVRGELLGRGLTSDLYTGQYGPGGVAVLLKQFVDHDTSDVRLNKLRWQVLWAGAKRYPGFAWTRGVHEDEDGRRTVIVEPAGDETLEQFLRRNEGGVDAGTALSIVRQLAEALQQAAELGFDYQFLQPATIMLEGETNPILLGLDLAGQFDLAALAADAPAAQVAFLSPEQRAAEESDERSLIYSLGVLLAALLEPAWLYGTDGRAADAVPEPPAEVLAALQEDVSPESFALLQVALQRNPASRHKDLSSFLQAARAAELAEAGDDGAAAAAAGLAQPRGWKPSGVPKSVVSAGSVEMAEPVTVASATADVAPPSSPPPPDTPYRGDSRQPRLGLILLYLLLAIVAAGAILFVLEPEIIDRLRRPGGVTEGPVAPSPTVFNLGIATTPEAPATTPAPAAATATATATAVPATASPTRATATATRPSPTATRATATPSPSPTATVIVPPPTTVLIFPTSTPLPPPPTEPPPPPPTEPPPAPPPTEPPPPPPTEPPPPPTPTEAPPATPTAPSP